MTHTIPIQKPYLHCLQNNFNYHHHHLTGSFNFSKDKNEYSHIIWSMQHRNRLITRNLLYLLVKAYQYSLNTFTTTDVYMQY